MKIFFVYGKWPSSFLARIFTGSECYHVGFTDGVHLWDMYKIRRRRLWPTYPPEQYLLADCPVEITAEYLDHKLDTDTSIYGVVDYLLFGLRWFYHLFGLVTRNFGGVICSEMVFEDLVANGYPRIYAEIPSPADLELKFLGRKDAIHA